MPIKENAALTDFTNVQTIVLNTFSFPTNIIYEHYNRDIQKTVSEKACPPNVMSPKPYADFPAAVQALWSLHNRNHKFLFIDSTQ